MPLSTILDLVQPASKSSPPPAASATYPLPKQPTRRKGRIVAFGCSGLALVLLVLLILPLVFPNGGKPTLQNLQTLTYADTYFDVVRVLGPPDKELEEREAAFPNIVLGYLTRGWILYVFFEEGSFDRNRTHYFGTLDADGNIIHAAEEQHRATLEALGELIRQGQQ